jgi:hypothetical protein
MILEGSVHFIVSKSGGRSISVLKLSFKPTSMSGGPTKVTVQRDNRIIEFVGQILLSIRMDQHGTACSCQSRCRQQSCICSNFVQRHSS